MITTGKLKIHVMLNYLFYTNNLCSNEVQNIRNMTGIKYPFPMLQNDNLYIKYDTYTSYVMRYK